MRLAWSSLVVQAVCSPDLFDVGSNSTQGHPRSGAPLHQRGAMRLSCSHSTFELLPSNERDLNHARRSVLGIKMVIGLARRLSSGSSFILVRGPRWEDVPICWVHRLPDQRQFAPPHAPRLTARRRSPRKAHAFTTAAGNYSRTSLARRLPYSLTARRTSRVSPRQLAFTIEVIRRMCATMKPSMIESGPPGLWACSQQPMR